MVWPPVTQTIASSRTSAPPLRFSSDCNGTAQGSAAAETLDRVQHRQRVTVPEPEAERRSRTTGHGSTILNAGSKSSKYDINSPNRAALPLNVTSPLWRAASNV